MLVPKGSIKAKGLIFEGKPYEVAEVITSVVVSITTSI